MNIKFVKDSESWFAISENAVWGGLRYDELLWAEIHPIGINVWQVRFEDDYNNPVIKNTLGEAKEFVLREYTKHKPFCNSKGYEIEEL